MLTSASMPAAPAHTLKSWPTQGWLSITVGCFACSQHVVEAVHARNNSDHSLQDRLSRFVCGHLCRAAACLPPWIARQLVKQPWTGPSLPLPRRQRLEQVSAFARHVGLETICKNIEALSKAGPVPLQGAH